MFVFTETYNPNVCIHVGVRALLKGEYELETVVSIKNKREAAFVMVEKKPGNGL